MAIIGITLSGKFDMIIYYPKHPLLARQKASPAVAEAIMYSVNDNHYRIDYNTKSIIDNASGDVMAEFDLIEADIGENNLEYEIYLLNTELETKNKE